jgi:hypothetical protein
MTDMVYADFQNLDDLNRLRLTCAGTREDLQRLKIDLRDGLVLRFYTDDEDEDGRPDEMTVDGIVRYNAVDRCWVAEVDWSSVRHRSDGVVSESA